MKEHRQLKNRIMSEVDRYYAKHKLPIKYKAVFGNLYSSLDAQTPREFANLMHKEGLVYIRQFEASRRPTTWIFPAFVSEMPLDQIELMILEAEQINKKASSLNMTTGKRNAWLKKNGIIE